MSINLQNSHLKDDIENFHSLAGLRVLVVDDDTDSCVLTSFFLETCGALVMTATSAFEALQALKQFKPDILISDIAMPEVDGYSLIRKLRAFDIPLKTIPAIALTGMSLQEGGVLAFKSGFQAYFVKPFDIENLVTEIVKLLK
ncbi:two-component system response regulator [Calothrix sp. HK-06]|nr:two-component system response regulator [Calothrix sp. HK-06]